MLHEQGAALQPFLPTPLIRAPAAVPAHNSQPCFASLICLCPSSLRTERAFLTACLALHQTSGWSVPFSFGDRKKLHSVPVIFTYIGKVKRQLFEFRRCFLQLSCCEMASKRRHVCCCMQVAVELSGNHKERGGLNEPATFGNFNL